MVFFFLASSFFFFYLAYFSCCFRSFSYFFFCRFFFMSAIFDSKKSSLSWSIKYYSLVLWNPYDPSFMPYLFESIGLLSWLTLPLAFISPESFLKYFLLFGLTSLSFFVEWGWLICYSPSVLVPTEPYLYWKGLLDFFACILSLTIFL